MVPATNHNFKLFYHTDYLSASVHNLHFLQVDFMDYDINLIKNVRVFQLAILGTKVYFCHRMGPDVGKVERIVHFCSQNIPKAKYILTYPKSEHKCMVCTIFLGLFCLKLPIRLFLNCWGQKRTLVTTR